jgi:hypothetical protein
MSWVTACSLILAPLCETMRAAAARRTPFDLRSLRAAVGIMVYFAMLDLITIAAYALWAGPQQFGVRESWPLVSYFIVVYLGTLLVAAGIITVIRSRPGLVRRVS